MYEDLMRVGEVYLDTGSIIETKHAVGISEVKVRRILITLGLWSSKSSERIQELLDEGLTKQEIAGELSISIKSVEAYMPYRRGMYGCDERTADSIRSELYRKMKKQLEDNMGKKYEVRELTEEIKEEPSWEEKLAVSRYETIAKYTDEMYEALADVSDAGDVISKRGDVYQLHLELLGSDEIEHKAEGKIDQSISRDVLVPRDLDLHALHFLIQKLFGWRHSHLHEFTLPEKDFDRLTAGRFGTYRDLCGVLFRYPTWADEEDFWDEDYEADMNPTTWFRKKYRRPYLTMAKCDTWIGNESVADWKKDSKEYLFDCHFDKSKEQLMENRKMDELFTFDAVDVRAWKKQCLMQIEELKQDIPVNESRAEEYSQDIFEDAQVIPYPFFQTIYYHYDFGDSWRVRISLEDVYTRDLYEDNGLLAMKADKAYKAEAKYFDRSGEKVDQEMRDILSNVDLEGKPICIAADGLSVCDDCGGVWGYDQMLGDMDDETKLWFKGMGWSSRRKKPENML